MISHADLHMVSRMTNGRTSVFWILCIMGTFAILSSTMSKNPVLKPFSTYLGTPPEWTGIVASASTIPGIIVSLPAASLSDILGRRKFLLVAGFVFASAPFLYLFITAWWQLIFVRFYHGFATAIFVPVTEASIAELFPDKRGERISLFSSATYVGRVAAPILGGALLLVTNSGFYALYLAVGVAGIAALITGLLFLAGRDAHAPIEKKSKGEIIKKVFQGWRVIVGNHSVLIASLIQACQYYAFGVVEFYLSGYLKESIELSWMLTGIVTGSLVAIPIVAKPYMGRVSDKIGRSILIVAGCIVSALPLLVIPYVANFWVLLSLALIYGFGFATVTAVTPALVSELVPKECVGASMGFLDTMMDVGQTLGPIISGLILASSLQYGGVFSSLAIVLLSSCIIFALFQARTQSLKKHRA